MSVLDLRSRGRRESGPWSGRVSNVATDAGTWRNSGRKSWPHTEMQWASSTTTPLSSWRASAPRSTGSRASRSRRDIQQPHPALGSVAEDLGLNHPRRRPRDALHGPDAAPPAKIVDLVLDERDQRRHDDRRAGLGREQRRQLEAQRLAETGRKYGEDVAALEDGPHHLELLRVQFGYAEHLLGRLDELGGRILTGDEAQAFEELRDVVAPEGDRG